MRFGATPEIDSLSLAISHLFAAVTGIPCDDSYHYTCCEEFCDFFASNDKDFKLYKEESKDESIVKMRELLTKHNPVSSILASDIMIEVNRIAKLKWARIIRSPIDVPEMLKQNL